MQTGAITGYFDVAQIALYAFWIFFFWLVFHIRSYDRKEGYPLLSDPVGNAEMLNAEPIDKFPGAPLTPIGNPLLAGVGPGSWAQRADTPELTYEDKLPRIVPLRAAPEFFLDERDPDPRGFTVVGGDDLPAGTVVDVWIDLADRIVRYYEVEVPLAEGSRLVLVPGTFSVIRGSRREMRVKSILAAQFAEVPVTKNPDQVSLLEEDKICAYYGAGTLYATAQRSEPWI
jgi:photosynthetic reaction center H subunit